MQYSKENLVKMVIYLEPETRTVKVLHSVEGVFVYDVKQSHVVTVVHGAKAEVVPIEKALSFLWANIYPTAFAKAEKEMREKKVDDFLIVKLKGIV